MSDFLIVDFGNTNHFRTLQDNYGHKGPRRYMVAKIVEGNADMIMLISTFNQDNVLTLHMPTEQWRVIDGIMFASTPAPVTLPVPIPARWLGSLSECRKAVSRMEAFGHWSLVHKPGTIDTRRKGG